MAIDQPPTLPAPPPAIRDALWPRCLLATLLALALVAYYATDLHLYLSWDFLRANFDRLKAWTDRDLLRAVLLYLAVYTLGTALSLPVSGVLSLLGGALFGLWPGLAAANIASTAGATLAFLSTRYLFRDLVQRWLGPRLAPINRGMATDGAWYLLTLRLVPVFPFFLVNAAVALTPMRLSTFWWVTQLGMLPIGLVILHAGTQLGSVRSPGDVFTPPVLLSFALLAVVPLLLRWALRSFLKPKATP
jgi:uncharacterized membrane protein YdjX (TVP38/TMEM64 family)